MKKPTKNRGTNLSLDSKIKREAQRLAKANGESLTEMVERLLVAEIVSPTQIRDKLDLMRELSQRPSDPVTLRANSSAQPQSAKHDALAG